MLHSRGNLVIKPQKATLT